MNVILARLKEMPPEERLGKLEHILAVHADRVPRGIWEPAYDWPSIEHVEAELALDRQFFSEVQSLVGVPSSSVEEVRELFERNAEQMRKLTRAGDGRESLRSYEFPPFFGRFNEELHCVERAYFTVRLDDLTFTTEFLGGGGFAEVYKAQHRDGRSFALKLFQHPHKRQRWERATAHYSRLIRIIMGNVADNFDMLQHETFARPALVPQHTHGWYVLEYVDGKSMQSLMESQQLTPEITASGLLTYATMLSLVHRSGTCFIDNNWGAIMIGKENKVVDYDAMPKMPSDAYPFCVLRYASREHCREEPFKPISDLESFALMIDCLFVGIPFLERDRLDLRPLDYSRQYPGERASRIPEHLRQVVVPLIQYPRDESIRAEDFVSAIMSDYGM
jgi:hypothetical protein